MESWAERVYDFSTSNISQIKIAEAVKELSRSHPFNDITVNMIYEKAKLSRQTFYYHFKGKWEVARWYWSYISSQYVIHIDENFSWHESLLKGYLDLYADREFFANVTTHEENEIGSLADFVYESRCAALLSAVEEYIGHPATSEITFQIKFFSMAEVPMVVKWINSSEPEPLEEFASKVESCIPQDLYNLVGRSARD